MNSNQPSIHRDPGSTTHSKYSFAKTPRFPSNNAMYQTFYQDAQKPFIVSNPNYRTERQVLDMEKKYNSQVSYQTPQQPIDIA